MNKIRDLYERYRHPVNYLFFGIVTTLVNWGCYSLFTCAGMYFRTANVLSWAVSVTTAFFTNRRWVFEGSDRIALEMVKFFAARAVTGAFEIAVFPLIIGMGFDASLLGVEYLPAKIAVTAAVTVLNYIFSRLFVFTGKKAAPSQDDETCIGK